MAWSSCGTLILVTTLLLACAGNTAKQDSTVGQCDSSDMTEDIALNHANNYFTAAGIEVSGLTSLGMVEVRSLWPDRNDTWLVCVKYKPHKSDSIRYGIIAVDQKTGRFISYNYDRTENPIHPLSDSAMTSYYWQDWPQKWISESSFEGLDPSSLVLGLVTPDTPRLDPMDWGIAIWVVRDVADQTYFISPNGVLHRVSLPIRCRHRLWPVDTTNERR